MSNDNFNVSVKGHVLAKSLKTGKILIDKENAVHPQNMARVIARALAKEDNYYVYRMAFGNGGTFTDSSGQTVYRPPNDGRDGSGWESRLYNETYSEIVDDTSPLVGTDPGSADANNVRPGGGAVPSDDSGTDNTVSQEVGSKSNIIVTVYLNQNEPDGQVASITNPSQGAADEYFDFDELGLYTSGQPARDSSGYATVNVGDKKSSDVSPLSPNGQYNITLTVDGTIFNAVLKLPSSGTGTAGEITYGDICEGINGGGWIVSGDQINDHIYVYITDVTNGTYPSILARQSYGFLNFESKSTGATSSVSLSCVSGNVNDFFNNLSVGICGNVNYAVVPGKDAGSANDSITPANERERLLTHLIFSPIRKSADDEIVIIYTLTVSVNPSTSTVINEIS
jgi:hypothetical protein